MAEDEVDIAHILIRKVLTADDYRISMHTSEGLSYFDAMGLVAVAQDSLAEMYEAMEEQSE